MFQMKLEHYEEVGKYGKRRHLSSALDKFLTNKTREKGVVFLENGCIRDNLCSWKNH